MITEDQKKIMIRDALDHYIYRMQQDTANQAAIDVYTELLNEYEEEE